MAIGKRKQKLYEEDFKQGLMFLKKKSMESHLYSQIAACNWIVPLSKVLSDNGGNCKKFWENTYNQLSLDKIPNCVRIEDIFYGSNTYLFEWARSPEGHDYWHNIAVRIINKTMRENKKLLNEL